MTARNGKTAIASTVFIDIVGYSRGASPCRSP